MSLDNVIDMDFLTFDDLLTTTLQSDAARSLMDFRVANHAAQGDRDSNKKLVKDLMRQAYPEHSSGPESARPGQSVGGLKKFLGAKGFAKGSKK